MTDAPYLRLPFAADAPPLRGSDPLTAMALDDAVRADRIAIQAYSHHGQPLPSVTVSVGVAQFPIYGSSRDELIAAADHALYAAKTAGRDRIKVYAGKQAEPAAALQA